MKAEEEPYYIAYLEDIFENEKNTKCVKLRWFLLGQEAVVNYPHLNPHKKEVYMTNNVEVIRANCVAGLVTVLTYEHFSKSLAVGSCNISPEIYVCAKQILNDKVVSFSVDKLAGYYDQEVVSSFEGLLLSIRKPLHHMSTVEEGASFEDEKESQASKNEGTPTIFWKTIGASLENNQKIEVLSQDGETQRCWFKCEVLKLLVSKMIVFVKYLDLQDNDKPANLKDSVLDCLVAKRDILEMRHVDRLTIRPVPPENSTEFFMEVGTAVDVWWAGGWWECVIVRIDSCKFETAEVYFPVKEEIRTVHIENMRISKDWVNNEWVSIKPKTDILNFIETKKKLLRAPIAAKRVRLEEDLKGPAIPEIGNSKRRLAVTDTADGEESG